MPVKHKQGVLSKGIVRAVHVSDIPGGQVHPLMLVCLRIWVALIFWKSGLLKLDWGSTLFLFEEEYKVPLLPPEVAAYLATFCELSMPVLLIIGLGARFAAFTLLCMTAIIQFTYDMNHEHVLWALALLAILLHGAGTYSWDFFIRKNQMHDIPKTGDGTLLLACLITITLSIFMLHESLAIMIESWEPWLDGVEAWWKDIGV